MMMRPGPPEKHQIRTVLSEIFAEATAEGLGGGLIIRYALPRRIGGRLPRSFFSKLMG